MTGDGFRVALVGAGIGESLTPAMHITEAAHLGIDYNYATLDILDLNEPPEFVASVVDRVRHGELDAFNVTHPCKQTVIPYLDALDPTARRIGAVNLVIGERGRCVGYNVDTEGFRRGITEGLPGADLTRVVQYGAGGAGAATADAVLSLGCAHLVVVDTDTRRRQQLADNLRDYYPSSSIEASSPDRAIASLSQATGVINATPIGMPLHPGQPFPVATLNSSAFVADVVYRPLNTQLLQAARARGLATLDGGRMAVGQAVASLRLITGHAPDPMRVRGHFLAMIHQENAANTEPRRGH